MGGRIEVKLKLSKVSSWVESGLARARPELLFNCDDGDGRFWPMWVEKWLEIGIIIRHATHPRYL